MREEDGGRGGEEEEEGEGGRRGARGNPTSGLQSVPNRCRISFISYWCYFVLSGLPSACNGSHGFNAQERTRVCVVCAWENKQSVCFIFICLFQLFQTTPSQPDLLPATNQPTNQPPPPLPPSLARPRDSEANVSRVCLPWFSRSVGDVFVFFRCVFLLRPRPNVTGACTAICQNRFVNSSRAFVAMGFTLKSLLLIVFPLLKASDTHGDTGLTGSYTLAS